MIRQAVIIPRLTKTFIPRRFLFFDTETYDVKMDEKKTMLAFRLGVALYVEYDPDGQAVLLGDHTFRDPLDFVALLRRYAPGNTAIYAVAHNIQFDMQTLDLPFNLYRAGIEADLPILSFAATLWKVRVNGKPLHFMDSMNLFPGKLEELGESVNVPKKHVSFVSDPDRVIIDYCHNDCAILLALFTRYRRFLIDNQLGYFGETIAWQAMNAYRSRFMTVNIHIHTNYEVLGYERKAYHGARCEAYFIGELPESEYTMLDVNGMYPFVMRDKPMPVEYLGKHKDVSPRAVDELMETSYCIAEVEIETDEPIYPLRTLTKLVFPVGCFTTWLHHSELQHARWQGHAARVRSILTYRRANLFQSYVEFFDGLKSDARSAGHRSEELMAKAFETALYGKWGQRNHVVHMLGKSDRPGVHCELVGRDGIPGIWEEWDWYGKRYSSVKIGERPYSSPAIAGAIAAYGRMYLWELKEKAGHDQTFYVDTDSLIVTACGKANLIELSDPHHLGSLKTVWESGSLTIHGAKDYASDSVVRHKGMVQGVRPGAEGGFSQEQWSHLGSQLKRGQHGPPVKTKIVKHRTHIYDKGEIQSDGSVKPWRLPEDLERLP